MTDSFGGNGCGHAGRSCSSPGCDTLNSAERSCSDCYEFHMCEGCGEWFCAEHTRKIGSLFFCALCETGDLAIEEEKPRLSLITSRCLAFNLASGGSEFPIRLMIMDVFGAPFTLMGIKTASEAARRLVGYRQCGVPVWLEDQAGKRIC